mmetsp:Transcript_9189/g.22827  ORF Transcript_9189/g.22827 Transcript_9189/m.22827 type:complete len:320 (+) Transcript_9189:146-1105(+)
MILQISILVFALVPSEAFIQQPKRSNFKHRDRDPASSMANLEETPSSSDTKNINLRMESGGDGKENIASGNKDIYKDDWKTAVDRFKKSVLDDSYLPVPIRGTSVNAGDLYPSSFPDQPGLMPGAHKHLGGAYDASDGCIYGVPANSKAILCMYPCEQDDEDNFRYKMTTIPLPERIVDREMKWLRGIVAHGYLWAIPAWADSVLCVDLDAFWGRRELAEGQSDVVRLIPLPEDHPKSMRWQWHGAGINKEQTGIYCIPSNARKVLKVDVATKTTSFIDIEYDQTTYPEFTLDVTNKWYGKYIPPHCRRVSTMTLLLYC